MLTPPPSRSLPSGTSPWLLELPTASGPFHLLLAPTGCLSQVTLASPCKPSARAASLFAPPQGSPPTPATRHHSVPGSVLPL